MKKYKLIACDLDGTLLNDNSQISENNKKAIYELVKKGIYFVPATGRTLSEFKELAENPDIQYIIHSTGAVVLDKQGGNSIKNCLSKEMTSQIMKVLSQFNPFFVIHCGGKLYGDSIDKNPDDYGIGFVVKDLLNNIAINFKNLEDEIYKMNDIESLCAFFTTQADADKCSEILLKKYNYKVTSAWHKNIEIMNPNAGKGNALTLLCNMLGIKSDDVIAVGDSDNDSDAFEVAGLKLATSNACQKLKNIADKVICSNNEDAVMYILKKYFS